MAKKKGLKLNTRKFVITLVAVYGTTSIVDLKMQQSQLSQELDAAYTQQTELQAELEYMSSEDAVEKIAREKGCFVGVEYHKRFDRRNLIARKTCREGL